MIKTINTPLCDEVIRGLKIGDIVYLNGKLATGRDEVFSRVARGTQCPCNLSGGVIFHAGPIVRESGEYPGRHELVSIGPTTSIRMEKWAGDFIEKTGVKLMIGKGGMGGKTAEACRKYGALHCVYPGGCAALGAAQVTGIENVFWRELGMGECIWVMEVSAFGPLIVSIDTQGNNLFAENAAHYTSRREACMAPVVSYLC
ncbi:MAG: FumA C-terminus/TtdB family hydratase beta subunit [Treponema sp.]|nr:FumA C-terminus/TtdB family hydratase beta subunit [Treponema sp.]